MDQDRLVTFLTAATLGVVGTKFLCSQLGNFGRIKLQERLAAKHKEFREKLENDPSAYQKMNDDNLMAILRQNEKTDFGKANCLEEIKTVDEFRFRFPLTHYQNFSEEIEKLCEGETNVLSSDALFYFATSSGTTGKQKMIPVTSGSFNDIQTLIGDTLGSTYMYLQEEENYQFTNSFKVAQIGYNPKNHPKTNGGTPYGPLSQCSRAFSGKENLLTKLQWALFNEIPLDVTDEVLHFETNLLLQVLFCLLTSKLQAILIGFGPSMNHFFVLLKLRFSSLLECIRNGDLSPEGEFKKNIPPVTFIAINRYIQANYSERYRKQRVKELEKIEDFQGVARKIWPNLIYANTSVSGSFSVYEKNIRYYLGDVPILGAVYLSSEASMGFQYNIEGDYMFHPSCSFFEFIPENQISAEAPSTLLLHELKVGERYELVLTTRSGFYRYRVGDVIEVTGRAKNSDLIPLFRIAYRTGSILDAYGEKTTEKHVEEALKRTAAELNCSLNNFTTYLEIDKSPCVYLLFPEFSKELSEEEKATVNEITDGHLRDIHKFYDQCREQQKLGSVQCFPVDNQKFADFTEILIKNGTAPLQVKIPHLLTKPEYLQFFLSDN